MIDRNERNERFKRMSLRSLAEAVILQSLEDLWNPRFRDESRYFFEGEGFRLTSEIAGMNSQEQAKILHLLEGRRHVRHDAVHRSARRTQ